MRVVIALGGNALLRRTDPMTTEVQRHNIRTAAQAIAPLAGGETQAGLAPVPGGVPPSQDSRQPRRSPRWGQAGPGRSASGTMIYVPSPPCPAREC
jgi:hypothetical protein